LCATGCTYLYICAAKFNKAVKLMDGDFSKSVVLQLILFVLVGD
jgi:hypothetical protein